MATDGGRLDLECETEENQILLKQILNHLRKFAKEYEIDEKPKKKIVSYIDIVNNPSVNAVAFVHDDICYIGIYKGIIFKNIQYNVKCI